MLKPLVSIVIPAYNEEKNIGRCLSSIKEQDYDGPYEIIVCDNNSSDFTAKMARELGVAVVFEERGGLFLREKPELLRRKAKLLFKLTLIHIMKKIG